MGRDQNIDTGLQISQLDFTTLYPIYYFSLEHLDLTRQSVVDIIFLARVTRGAIADYRAIAVILSDNSMLLEGAGGRMRVVDAPVENMLHIIRSSIIIIMSYNHVSVTLTPGQIKRLQQKTTVE
jgi:hypothetical protein